MLCHHREDEPDRPQSTGEAADVDAGADRTSPAHRHHLLVQQDKSNAPPPHFMALVDELNDDVPLANIRSSASVVHKLDGAFISPTQRSEPNDTAHSSILPAGTDNLSKTNVPAAAVHPLDRLGVEDAASPLPVFTSREEEIEFASLPTEEIVAAEADVLGLTEDMARVNIGTDVANELVQLEAELALIPDAAKAAYVDAMCKCPELVDEEHKKAFLWREEYDAKLAAKRLAKYWELRRALFGKEQCYLPLTLAGALRDDGVALRHCILRILPNKDESGRVIVLWYFEDYLDTSLCSKESMLRACWYTLHVASQDPVVRGGGFVILAKSVSSLPPSLWNDGHLFWTHIKLGQEIYALESDALPIVFRGVHWYRPNIRFHLVAPIIKFMLGKRLRGRFKVHYGSEEAGLKSLEKYGMTRECLPRELGGDVALLHHQWLADRVAKECGTFCVPAAVAASTGLVKSSSPVDIEGNDQMWEPIRIGTKSKSVLDGQEKIMSTAFQLHQEATSRVDELDSMSSFTRKSQRQKQVCDLQCGNMEHKFATVPSAGLDASETLVADEQVLSNDANECSKKRGRKGDPRMNKALKAKLENPDLSAEDALLAGGFVFPNLSPFIPDNAVLDTDKVTLAQRKHQFRRRLRVVKKEV